MDTKDVLNHMQETMPQAVPGTPLNTNVEADTNTPLAEPNGVTAPDPERSVASADPTQATPSADMAHRLAGLWTKWFSALKQVLPLYIGVHLAFFVTTCLAVLFTLRDFEWSNVPLPRLWESWHHWDTGYYLVIARFGYQKPEQAAFFPLQGVLERLLTYTHLDVMVAGLLISNVAGLLLLMVLYQLVHEDFDHELGQRTILYLSIFPTAFFLASAYNESLFIFLALFSFYNMRHGNWWLAGLSGFFAGLTRSAGIFLLVPFAYEYLRQHEFRFKNMRLDVLAGALIPSAIGLFALYCYYRFHDLLAFSHAQAHWNHEFHLPWYGILQSLHAIRVSDGVLSFQALRNLLDVGPDLLMLGLIVLLFVGPWRFPRRYLSYGLYAVALYLFLQLFPVGGTGLFPLQSVSRYLLELFPAFIVLAMLGRSRMFNMCYLMIAGSILFFLLTQFLTGHWVL